MTSTTQIAPTIATESPLHSPSSTLNSSITPASPVQTAEVTRRSPAIASIDILKSWEDFDRVQSAWNTIHALDAEATVFTSWAWLKGFCQTQETQPYILAIRVDRHDDYVGFLPLKRNTIKRLGITIEDRLEMLGNHGADYTGFICHPEYETVILEACAQHLIHQAKWGVLKLNDILDSRFEQFLNFFQGYADPWEITTTPAYACPFISLDRTWDDYLNTAVSTSRRKKIRKLLQKVEEDTSIQISMATADSFDQGLEEYFQMHRLRWDTYTDENVETHRKFLRWCFDHDLLRLLMVRQGETPIAHEILFYDAKQQSLGMYAGGYSPDFAKLSPGYFNIAYLVREGIQGQWNIKTLDFLRGDEDYKSSFGTEERWTQHVTIVRSRRSRWLRQAQAKLAARQLAAQQAEQN